MDSFVCFGDSAADVAKGLSSVQGMIAQLFTVVTRYGKGDQVVIDQDFDFGLAFLNHVTGVILDYQGTLDERQEEKEKMIMQRE